MVDGREKPGVGIFSDDYLKKLWVIKKAARSDVKNLLTSDMGEK